MNMKMRHKEKNTTKMKNNMTHNNTTMPTKKKMNTKKII